VTNQTGFNVGPLSPALTVVSFEATPRLVGLDEVITVTMIVSNSSGSAVLELAPSLTVTGDGRVGLEYAPTQVAVVQPGETATFVWRYRSLAGGTVLFDGRASGSNGVEAAAGSTGTVTIHEAGDSLAALQVYPLPFIRSQALGGTLKFRRMPPYTKVRIYTVAGELVREMEASVHGLVEWDGRNEHGSFVAPSVYFYVCQPPTGGRRLGKVEVNE